MSLNEDIHHIAKKAKFTDDHVQERIVKSTRNLNQRKDKQAQGHFTRYIKKVTDILFGWRSSCDWKCASLIFGWFLTVLLLTQFDLPDNIWQHRVDDGNWIPADFDMAG